MEPISLANSTSLNIGQIIKNKELSAYLTTVVLVFYPMTFLIGVTGNGIVIYMIAYFSKVRKKSVANYYIWNLAFSDLLFCFTLPLFCYSTYTKEWPFGNVSCKLAYLFRDMTKFSSILTLVALSVDRLLASYHNMAHLRSMLVGKLVCIAVWLLAFAVSSPYLAFVKSYDSKNKTICVPDWPKNEHFTFLVFWAYFQFAVGLFIPLVIIIACYTSLLRRTRQFMKFRNRRNSIKRPSRKMTQTVVVVVVIFIFCQTPYYINQIITAHRGSEMRQKQEVPGVAEYSRFVYFGAVSQILLFISSCCNPILYGLLNENYRKLYRIVLCKCERRGPNPEELREYENDGHAPVHFKLHVAFHMPCSCSDCKEPRNSIEDVDECDDVIDGETTKAAPSSFI